MPGTGNGRALSWIHLVNGLLGAWLIVGTLALPGVLGISPPAQAVWNAVIVGGIIVVASLIGAATVSPIPHWVQVAAGAWLLVSPLILWYGYGNTGFNDIFVGLVVTMLGLVGAFGKTGVIRRRISGR
jgi:hypothetical protein